jgi:hypothetical protein
MMMSFIVSAWHSHGPLALFPQETLSATGFPAGTRLVAVETLLQLNLWNLGLVWFDRDFSQVPFQ